MMKKLKTILFFVLYCLFSVGKAQQIEWNKKIQFSTASGLNTICFSKFHNSFKFGGGAEYNSILGELDNNGDTLNLSKYYNDSIVFAILKLKSSQANFYAKTVLFNSISWNEEQNITKFDANGSIIWRTSYNIGYDDWYKGFMVLPNGSSLITGYRGSPQYDIYFTKIDRNGIIVFENQINQLGIQFVYDIKTYKDGSQWICGAERPFTTFNANPFIIKFDSDGDLIDKDTLPDLIPTDTNGVPNTMCFTPDNHIIFEWVSNNESTIIKTDTNYNIIWQTPNDQKVTNPRLLDDNTVFTYGLNNVKLYDYATGNLVWSHSFTNTNGTIFFKDYAFDDSNNVVLAASLYRSSSDQDMYFAKISGVGKPIKFYCNNPPQIQIATASVVGTNKSVNLGSEVIENLKYSDVIAYNWYFEDGGQTYGQYINYDFDEIQYPSSFWCMLVVTDAVGCTDTMTIDAYTGAIVDNPVWPPLGIEEVKNNSASLIKPTIYPNPFTNEIRLKLNSSNVKSYSVYVYNVLGKIIHSSIEMNNETTINLKTYPKGTYIIKLKTDDFIYSERIIKE